MKRKRLLLLKQKMAIQKTKPSKAAGHDVISPDMIKYMSKAGKTMIFNITKLA